MECSDLYAFQAFDDYMSVLRNRTSFNETLLEQCRDAICGALWGYGVPDISGIGVSLVYIVVTILGPLLSVLFLLALSTPLQVHTRFITRVLKHAPSRICKRLPTQSGLQDILTAGLSTFFESAVYFALAIEIATIAILAPKDYESQTVAFGDYDARTCSLVSTICLLPLLYPISIFSLLSSTTTSSPTTPQNSPLSTTPLAKDPQTPTPSPASTFLFQEPPQASMTPINPAQSISPPHPLLSSSTIHLKTGTTTTIQKRQHYRLTLFTIPVLLSIYPFLSSSLRIWSPSQIGAGNGDGGATYVTEEEWLPVTTVCFNNNTREVDENMNTLLTQKENVVLGVFQTTAAVAVVLFNVAVLLPEGLRAVGWFCGVDLGAGGAEGGGNGNRSDGLGFWNGLREDRDENDCGGGGLVVTAAGKIMRVCDRVKRLVRCNRWARGLLLLVPVGLAIPLLWGFWRLRALQAHLARSSGRSGRNGNGNEGDEWSFGQVVAITLFVPVVAEMVFTAVSEGSDIGEGAHQRALDERGGGEK